MPQVVLAQWYDTYGYAARVDYLGIGLYSNKSCAPTVEANEFARALLRIVGGKGEETAFRRKARELGKISQASNGREGAADIITREARAASRCL